MVSWWNQAQNPASGMWGSPMMPSMDPYSQTQTPASYMHGYSSSSGGGTNEANNYWNGYHSAPAPAPAPAPPTQSNDPYVPPPPSNSHSNSQGHNDFYSHGHNNDFYSRGNNDVQNQDPHGYNSGPHQQTKDEEVNVGAVLAERLKAQQIVNNDPYDDSAKAKIAECDVKIKQWNSRQAIAPYSDMQNNHDVKRKLWGTKSGPQDRYVKKWSDLMKEKDRSEMSNRQKKREFYGNGQAWVREDFFHRLQPANSSFGLKILKGMGWKHGQAIGKNKEGHVAPIAVDVRYGREGLHTKEERIKYNLSSAGGRPKPLKQSNPIKKIGGKHPVSLLAEHCMRRKIPLPKYDLVFEYGNFQSKSVLMNVTVEGKTFEPAKPSPYKKYAKSEAAAMALKHLGFLDEQ